MVGQLSEPNVHRGVVDHAPSVSGGGDVEKPAIHSASFEVPTLCSGGVCDTVYVTLYCPDTAFVNFPPVWHIGEVPQPRTGTHVWRSLAESAFGGIARFWQ
jgi:hypothetical protein